MGIAANLDLNRMPHDIMRAKNEAADGNVKSDVGEVSRGILEEYQDIPPLWAPTSLKKPILYTFSLCFMTIAISLPILFSNSRGNNGLCSVMESERIGYSWTYVPTAVFALIAALWTRVEFRIRQAMPWQNASVGGRASETILLDYLSSLSVVSFFRSIKKRHFPVVVSLLCSFLLGAMVIISTGLFTVQDFEFVTTVPVKVTQSLNESEMFKTGTSPTLGNFWTVGYSIQYLNLSYPSGTTRNYAFPKHDLVGAAKKSDGTYSNLSVELDVFVWDLSCKEAGSETMDGRNITFFADVCRFDFTEQEIDKVLTGLEKDPKKSYKEILYGSCNRTSKYRFSSEMAYFIFLEASFHENSLGYKLPMKINNATAEIWFKSISCNARYNITQGIVTTSKRANGVETVQSVTIPQNASSRRFKITDDELAEYINMSRLARDQARAQDAPQKPWIEASIDATCAAGPQLAQMYLMDNSTSTTTGLLTTSEHRLVMRPLSFALLEAFTIISFVLVLALVIWYTPAPVTSRDPGSLGALATILARSPRFHSSLLKTKSFGEKSLSKELGNHSYCTRTELGSFQIIQTEGAAKASAEEDLEKCEWWQPISVKRAARAAIVGLPLAIIIALEILLRHSNSAHGIADVPRDGEAYLRFSWIVVPALIMASLQASVVSIAFNIKLFRPYYLLGAYRGCNANCSMLDDNLGKLSIICLWKSIKQKNVAVAAVSMAVILVPFLTILVSGLYTVKDIEVRRPALITQLDAWKFTSPQYRPYNLDPEVVDAILYTLYFRLSETPAEAWIPGLIMQLNMSFPPWIHEQFAFPTFTPPLAAQLSSPSSDKLSDLITEVNGSKLIATVPAVRVDMNCTIVSHEVLNISSNKLSEDWEPSYCSGRVNMPYPISPNCSAEIYDFSYEAVSGTHFEMIRTLEHDDFARDKYSGCHPAIFVFGGMSPTCEGSDINMVTCMPFVEQVDVEATFKLPYYTIDDSNPLKAVPGSAKYLCDFANLNALPKSVDNIDSVFSPEDSPFNWLLYYLDSEPDDSKLREISPWTRMVSEAHDGLPISELLSSAGASRYVAGLSRVLGMRTATLLRYHGLSPTASADTIPSQLPKEYNATVVDAQHARLVQDRRSTRALQAVLGAVSLLCAVALLATDTRRVLPGNPCSIAAAGKLLAGSQLLQDMPEGAEWWSDKKLKREVFDGWSFSMGWWAGDPERNTARRFGIDIGSHPAGEVDEIAEGAVAAEMESRRQEAKIGLRKRIQRVFSRK